MYKGLKRVKQLIEMSPKFIYCTVDVYLEPKISSVVFFINTESYHHIFKAPFGLLEVTKPDELATIIIEEVLEWRNRYEG